MGISRSLSGDLMGDCGKGTDNGETASRTKAGVPGEDVEEDGASGVVVAEASPIANVARSRSSRVNLGICRSSLSVGVGDFSRLGEGLPARWVTNDLLRLDKADSASWFVDSPRDLPALCMSNDPELLTRSALSDEMS